MRRRRSAWPASSGAFFEIMERDAKKMRNSRPFVFTNLRAKGVGEIAKFIEEKGGTRV